MTLRPGDPLPDLTLLDTEGREVALAALGGEETLIIFLRHLA
jgi:peroxiredoxin